MASSRVPGIWLISLAAFCSMASMRVCDPMLVELSNQFQVSVGEASAVISAFAVAYGCLQLFYGPENSEASEAIPKNLLFPL